MRKLFCITILNTLLTYSSAYAQEFLDTISFYKTTVIETYDQLPSLTSESIVDTLTEPEGFIFRDEEAELRILVKEGAQWKEWKFFEQSSYWGNHIERAERVKFGTGKDKLVIHWQHSNGRSGWESGFSEDYQGIQIWDLENKTRMLELQTNNEYHYWWTNYEEDTTQSVPYEEREVLDSGGESSHYESEVTIEKNKIIIKEIRNEENDQPLGLCSREYVLSKNQLVLKNKKCERLEKK